MIVLAAGAPAFAEQTPIDHGYSQMYNLQFDEAHATFRAWERAHPDDPLGPASDAAAYLFAEFHRLHILQSEFFTEDSKFLARGKPAADPSVERRFEDAIARARGLAAKALARSPGDANAEFAEVLRLGLHADYLALIEKSYLASLSEMKAARVMADQLLSSHPDMYDAYLAAGVENYMLSLKPAPVRWLLRMTGAQTDKDQGIKQLRLTAEKGRYLRPYARLLLAVAALRDGDRQYARTVLAELSKQYPGNGLYAHEMARLR